MPESENPYLYKRVLLKISGEMLAGDRSKGNFDSDILQSIAKDIATLANDGIEVAIVVGGGNIFRGMEANLHGIERATADYMGMLATAMNALALQSALEYTDRKAALEVERLGQEITEILNKITNEQ